jgi:hypothetical protein
MTSTKGGNGTWHELQARVSDLFSASICRIARLGARQIALPQC